MVQRYQHHVLAFADTLVGSNQPIAFDRAALQARLQDPWTIAHYLGGGVDAAQLLERALLRGPIVFGPDHDRASLTDVNTDLFPKDEYLTSRRFLPGER